MPNKHKDMQISLRDHFAGLAMQGLLSANSIKDHHLVSVIAYEQADAMLAERNKTKAIQPHCNRFSGAPEWAVCFASDESGTSYYYDRVPTLGTFAWITQPNGRKVAISKVVSKSGDTFGDWKNSLVMRGAE